MLLCALRKISVFRQTCKKSEETCRPAGLLRLLLLHYHPQRLTHRAADHAAQHRLDHGLDAHIGGHKQQDIVLELGHSSSPKRAWSVGAFRKMITSTVI